MHFFDLKSLIAALMLFWMVRAAPVPQADIGVGVGVDTGVGVGVGVGVD